jgi:hypothetical protein
MSGPEDASASSVISACAAVRASSYSASPQARRPRGERSDRTQRRAPRIWSTSFSPFVRGSRFQKRRPTAGAAPSSARRIWASTRARGLVVAGVSEEAQEPGRRRPPQGSPSPPTPGAQPPPAATVTAPRLPAGMGDPPTLVLRPPEPPSGRRTWPCLALRLFLLGPRLTPLLNAFRLRAPCRRIGVLPSIPSGARSKPPPAARWSGAPGRPSSPRASRPRAGRTTTA